MTPKFIIPKDVFKDDDAQYDNYEELANKNYPIYYDIVKNFDVYSIIEIGVRLGYSAYSMLSANPKGLYVGIDPERIYPVDYAYNLLIDNFPEAIIHIHKVESQNYKFATNIIYDLCHIDGDHSESGCYKDLEKFTNKAKHTIVHDFDHIPAVRNATLRFLKEHSHFDSEYIPCPKGILLIHNLRTSSYEI